MEQADWITREAVGNPTVIAALHELGRGEAEAVALAVENPGSLLILDERRGRLAAINLHVNIIGTLGVLLVAKRKGLLAALMTKQSPREQRARRTANQREAEQVSFGNAPLPGDCALLVLPEAQDGPSVDHDQSEDER